MSILVYIWIGRDMCISTLLTVSKNMFLKICISSTTTPPSHPPIHPKKKPVVASTLERLKIYWELIIYWRIYNAESLFTICLVSLNFCLLSVLNHCLYRCINILPRIQIYQCLTIWLSNGIVKKLAICVIMI